jgi:hypothetical protein
MHQCSEHGADLIIDGVCYRLDTLPECKRMARLRGTRGIVFADYVYTHQRLEEQHKQGLARRRAEKKAS